MTLCDVGRMAPDMELRDFDFDLPDDLIALRPVVPRRAARLLESDRTGLTNRSVSDLPACLRAGDLLVFNDTRVIPARLSGVRSRQTQDGSGMAKVEATLIERASSDTWIALAKPARRLAPGDRISFATLTAEVVEKSIGGRVQLTFDASGDALDIAIAEAGVMPLPPYISARRAADARDASDYQTLFAARDGAVAAPTAALHFDEVLMKALAEAGVSHTFVTLHVGAGTFLPVTAERIDDHKMHREWGEVGQAAADAITQAKTEGRRVIPVGTTSLRLLESAGHNGEIAPWQGDTEIFIRPGHEFQIADGLMTNFHLPKSTLLMLVAALIGMERMNDVYAHAVREKYRFFSYGDASLLFPG